MITKEKLKQALSDLIINGASCRYLYNDKNFAINLTIDIRGTISAEFDIGERFNATYLIVWQCDENSDLDKVADVAIHNINDCLEMAVHSFSEALKVAKVLKQ